MLIKKLNRRVAPHIIILTWVDFNGVEFTKEFEEKDFDKEKEFFSNLLIYLHTDNRKQNE